MTTGGNAGENAENFSLADFFDVEVQTFAAKIARFAPFARELKRRGTIRREIGGAASHRVSVRDPVTGVFRDVLMFGSNNYLGLANEPSIIERTIEATRRYGVGCGGPPLLNGTTSLHRELERRLAAWKHCEDAMLFASGYAANVGWVTGLLAPGDVLVYDAQSHASLYDGIKMGRTRSITFAHNDVADLRRQLMQVRWQKASANIVVCVEGVYSMDGDIAPLAEIHHLCERYGALLVVDDAHGSGVLGARGGGTAEHFGLDGKIDVVMGTFSKVFTVTGGFVAGKRDMIDYLRCFARSHMFSAALPPPTVASVLGGLDFLAEHPERVERLHANVRYLVRGLRDAGFDANHDTAIVPLFLPPGVDASAVVSRLHEEGLFVNAIEFPAVPRDRQRLRLSVMATFSHADLDFAVHKLAKVGRELGFAGGTAKPQERANDRGLAGGQAKPDALIALPRAHAANGIASVEERLLILLTLAQRSDEEEALTWALASSVGSWDRFGELAAINATAPLVVHNMQRMGVSSRVPASVREPLERAASRVAREGAARLLIAEKVLRKLKKRGVDVVILKGMLFAATVYAHPHYKKMNDIDVLVRVEDLDAIFETYEELDLFSAAELVGSSERGDPKKTHHAPPFLDRALTFAIGTHWGLITPHAPYRLDYDAIWRRTVDLDFRGIRARAMSPEDNLHHLAIHLPYYKTGLRELADLYNLIRHHRARFDWAMFLDTVRAARTENLVYHALGLTNRVCPMLEIEEILSAIRPAVSEFYLTDTERKTRSLPRLLRSRSVHLATIERAYADFRSTSEPLEKWEAFARVWSSLLAPPAAEAAKLDGLERDWIVGRLRARLMAPARISRVFVRDLGAPVYGLMLAHSCFDMARSVVTAPLRANVTREDRAAFARKHGIDPARFEAFKDSVD